MPRCLHGMRPFQRLVAHRWPAVALIASVAGVLFSQEAHAQAKKNVWSEPPEGDLPFPTWTPTYKNVSTTELAADFLRCPQEAEKRGEHGDVFVTVASTPAIKVWSSPGVGSRTRSCLESVAQRLVALENRRGWRATSYSAELSVGVPTILFSDTDGLLQAWRRYLEHPGFWRAWLLKRRLPEDVTLLPHGCLALADHAFGRNVKKALNMWLEQLSAKKIADPWLQALNLRANGDNPLAFSAVFLLAPDLFLKVDDLLLLGGRLCLDPISPARRSSLRAQITSIDSCFVGDLDRILLSPTTLCPPSPRE